MQNLTFNEAVKHVLTTKGVTYSFVPKTKNGRTIGGEIFILSYCKDHETEPDEYTPYLLNFTSGLFNESEGEGEIYSADYIPDEAKNLTYQTSNLNSNSVSEITEIEIQYTIHALRTGEIDTDF